MEAQQSPVAFWLMARNYRKPTHLALLLLRLVLGNCPTAPDVGRMDQFISTSVGAFICSWYSLSMNANVKIGAPLTPREKQILKIIIDGRSKIKDIAHYLGISEGTVKTHLKHAYFKLDVHNMIEAIIAVIKSGTIEIEIGPGYSATFKRLSEMGLEPQMEEK